MEEQPRLLTEEEFRAEMQDAMGDIGLALIDSQQVIELPDTPHLLAREGGGDDPNACAEEVP